jgi:hypothetical protein
LAPFGAVYIEVPKVACTSIKVALAEILGVPLPRDGDPHSVAFPAPVVDRAPTAPLYPGLFSFAFVRNPWDRLVSCYRDKLCNETDGYTYFTIRPGVANCLARFDEFVADMSFAEFVEAVASIPDDRADAHFRSQATFVTDDHGRVGVDFVGRYERLVEDFEEVRAYLVMPELTLPRLQAARKSKSYMTYYTPHLLRVVERRYAEDIELFSYTYNIGADDDAACS